MDAARPGSRQLRCSSPGRAGAYIGRLVDAGIAGHGGVKLVDAGLDAGADVAQQAAAPLAGPGKGVDHVVDEDKVPGLLAVAENQAGLARQQAAGEDGHHPGLAAQVLAGAVHVGQRQGGVLQPVQLPVGEQVVAHGLLGHAVRRQRPLGLRLLDRQLFGVAVDRPPARREHHLAGARRPSPLEGPQRPQDVDVGVEHRVGHRDPDVGLGGQVEDDLGLAPGHQLDQVGRTDVELVEMEPAATGAGLRQVGQRARGQVVHHVDRVALGESRSTSVEPMNPAPPVTSAR